MVIELYESQIPSLITWFNNFIGFRELQKRLERVDQKLRASPIIDPMLERRYAFQAVYSKLIRRNRLGLAIDARELRINRAVTFIHSIQIATQRLSPKSIDILRSKVRDCLSPDRDWRELEHEMRVLVHYLQNNCIVSFADYEEGTRFDYRVNYNGLTFEVECKTFADNLGGAITLEQAAVFSEAFISLKKKDQLPVESGMLTFTKKSRQIWKREEIEATIRSYVTTGSKMTESDQHRIEFEPHLDWSESLKSNRKKKLLDEIFERHDANNFHRMIAISPSKVTVFELATTERPKIFARIFDKLREASSQFSGQYPAVIWAHFMGLNEEEFIELRDGTPPDGRRAFDIIGNWLFTSDKRTHIAKLRLSTDEQRLREHNTSRSSKLLIPERRSFSTGGLVYDMNSNRSEFGNSPIPI